MKIMMTIKRTALTRKEITRLTFERRLNHRSDTSTKMSNMFQSLKAIVLMDIFENIQAQPSPQLLKGMTCVIDCFNRICRSKLKAED